MTGLIYPNQPLSFFTGITILAIHNQWKLDNWVPDKWVSRHMGPGQVPDKWSQQMGPG